MKSVTCRGRSSLPGSSPVSVCTRTTASITTSPGCEDARHPGSLFGNWITAMWTVPWCPTSADPDLQKYRLLSTGGRRRSSGVTVASLQGDAPDKHLHQLGVPVPADHRSPWEAEARGSHIKANPRQRGDCLFHLQVKITILRRIFFKESQEVQEVGQGRGEGRRKK